MSKEMPENFTYENNMLSYEFCNNDFSKDLYKDFEKFFTSSIVAWPTKGCSGAGEGDDDDDGGGGDGDDGGGDDDDGGDGEL